MNWLQYQCCAPYWHEERKGIPVESAHLYDRPLLICPGCPTVRMGRDHGRSYMQLFLHGRYGIISKLSLKVIFPHSKELHGLSLNSEVSVH